MPKIQMTPKTAIEFAIVGISNGKVDAARVILAQLVEEWPDDSDLAVRSAIKLTTEYRELNQANMTAWVALGDFIDWLQTRIPEEGGRSGT